MDVAVCIRPLEDTGDTAGAVRIFQEFLELYQTMLVSAERYFEQIMAEAPPEFAQGYAPWSHAVKDLSHGVYVVAKKLPLQRPQALAEALRLLSVDSAVTMLEDIYTAGKRLANNWGETFRQNLRTLTEAFRVLVRQHAMNRRR